MSITVLTYDSEARMAYLYAGQRPRNGRKAASAIPTSVVPHGRIDLDTRGRPIGVEFPARDRTQAIRFALEIELNLL
jgi:uncharacterized protein YuzE